VKILEEPQIAAIPPVYVEVPRRSIAFHHGLTVHLAGAKQEQSHPPRAYDDLLPRRRHAHQTVRASSVDRPGIKVGEAIDSDLTPIVWRRGRRFAASAQHPTDPAFRASQHQRRVAECK